MTADSSRSGRQNTKEPAPNEDLVDGKYSIKDLVDIGRLRSTFEEFSQATGFTTGFVSYPEQDILICTGWRDVCTKYHRDCALSAGVCRESNIYLTTRLKNLKELSISACNNGLVHGATPVIIRGKHVASVSAGQVLFEPPDLAYFKWQAKKYGYDEEAYLAAIKQVPVVTRQQFEQALRHLSSLSVFVAEEGLNGLRANEAARALRISEEKYRALFQATRDAIIIRDRDGRVLDCNEAAVRLFKCDSREDLRSTEPTDFSSRKQEDGRDSATAALEHIERAFLEGSCFFEWLSKKQDGAVFPTEVLLSRLEMDGRPVFQALVRDISDRKGVDERIAQLNRVRAILGGVDRAIVHIADRQSLLDEVCRVAVEDGGFKLAWIGVASPDGYVLPVAKAGATGYLEGTRISIHDDEAKGCAPVSTAIRENRSVAIVNIERDACMGPWRERALEYGLRYAAVFPLRVAGKAIGSFHVYSTRAAFFDANELKLLTQVSEDISFALTAMDDATRRKRAEEDLLQSEQRYRALVEQAPDGLFVLDPEVGPFAFVDVNTAACQMFGYTRKEALGMTIADVLVPEELSRVALKIGKLKSGETTFGEWRLRRKDGSVFPAEVRTREIPDGRFQGFVRDLTEHKRLEQDVLEISEHELNRIGQELHDDICQWLAGTALLAGGLAKNLAKESPANAARALEVAENTQHALQSLRMLARGLTPAVIESEGGLTGALLKLAANVEEMFHIHCPYECAGTVEVHDEVAALHLYRIAQEAISNAVRHGEAQEVGIVLRSDENRVSMMIRDDGCGILQPLPETSGMGLRSMRYRAEIIGATLEIRPGAHGGTEIVCTYPTG